MMGSYNEGKGEVRKWILEHFPRESSVLDVGACDGKWRLILYEYDNIDAVEAFPANAERIKHLYRNTFLTDICEFGYKWYDLIIFGDVLEHLSVERAQAVLEFARPRCKDMVIGIPFQYKQDAIYGNPWERHIQDDLTPERFDERYPGFKMLLRARRDYAYYIKA